MCAKNFLYGNTKKQHDRFVGKLFALALGHKTDLALLGKSLSDFVGDDRPFREAIRRPRVGKEKQRFSNGHRTRVGR